MTSIVQTERVSMTSDTILCKEDWDILNEIKVVAQRNNTWNKEITGEFTNDFDINYFHNRVLSILKNEKIYLVSDLKVKIIKNIGKINVRKLTMIKFNSLRASIISNMNKIKSILSDERINSYLEQSKPLLAQYNAYKEISLRESINKNYNFIDLINIKSDDNSSIKADIIEFYLEVASNFIDMNIIRKKEVLEDRCMCCLISLKDCQTNDNGFIICPNDDCNAENPGGVICIKNNFEESHKSKSSDVKSAENFFKVLANYQGKSIKLSKEEEDKIMKLLDEHFINDYKPNYTSEIVKQLPLNSRGRRGDTTHKMLISALQKIRKTKYYKYVNYLGHKYWGWKLPDVSHLEETIKTYFINDQQHYNQIPISKRNRKSILGMQFLLFNYLKAVGHECYEDEFKIAEDERSYDIHIENWSEIRKNSKNIKFNTNTEDVDVSTIPFVKSIIKLDPNHSQIETNSKSEIDNLNNYLDSLEEDTIEYDDTITIEYDDNSDSDSQH